MNSTLLTQEASETNIKELLKDIETVKCSIDIFRIFIEEQLNKEKVNI